MKKPNIMSPYALEGDMRGERPLPRGLPDLCRRVTAREIFPAEIKNYPNPLFCNSGVRIVPVWWSSSNLKRIIKDTILNHQINVFAFFRGIPKNDDKSSIFQYLYMLLVSNRCRHLRFARHNTQAILESVLLL